MQPSQMILEFCSVAGEIQYDFFPIVTIVTTKNHIKIYFWYAKRRFSEMENSKNANKGFTKVGLDKFI